MDGRHRAGGSRALVSLIEKAGGAIYADLLREYGVDLRHLFDDSGELSPKRALILIENLPPSSRTVTLIGDNPEAYGWDLSAHMLASVIDTIRENTYTNVQVRTKKRIDPPEPFTRPGVEKEAKERKPNKFVQMAQQQFALHNRSE